MLFLSLLLWLSLTIPEASPWTISSSNGFKRIFEYKTDTNHEKENVDDVGSINMRLKELFKCMDYFMSFTKEMYDKMSKILDKMAIKLNPFHKNEEDKTMKDMYEDEYENEYENFGSEPTLDEHGLEILEELEGDNTTGSEPTLNERDLRLLDELEVYNTKESMWRSGSLLRGKQRKMKGSCIFDDSLLIKDKARRRFENGQDYGFDSKQSATQWKNNQIPFYFDKSISERVKHSVNHQISIISQVTCISFRELKIIATKKVKPDHHLRIQSVYRENICAGKVNLYPKAKSEVTLTLVGDFDVCGVPVMKGIIIHELLHVLGFAHTHKRSDRDDYMNVDEKCIKDKTLAGLSQYTKTEEGDLDNLGIPYLCNSIMHYPELGDPQCPILKPKKWLKCKDGKAGNHKLLPEDWAMIYIAHCCKHKNKYNNCWKMKERGRCKARKWAKWMGVNCAQSCKCNRESHREFIKKKYEREKR